MGREEGGGDFSLAEVSAGSLRAARHTSFISCMNPVLVSLTA